MDPFPAQSTLSFVKSFPPPTSEIIGVLSLWGYTFICSNESILFTVESSLHPPPVLLLVPPPFSLVFLPTPSPQNSYVLLSTLLHLPVLQLLISWVLRNVNPTQMSIMSVDALVWSTKRISSISQKIPRSFPSPLKSPAVLHQLFNACAIDHSACSLWDP